MLSGFSYDDGLREVASMDIIEYRLDATPPETTPSQQIAASSQAHTQSTRGNGTTSRANGGRSRRRGGNESVSATNTGVAALPASPTAVATARYATRGVTGENVWLKIQQRALTSNASRAQTDVDLDTAALDHGSTEATFASALASYALLTGGAVLQLPTTAVDDASAAAAPVITSDGHSAMSASTNVGLMDDPRVGDAQPRPVVRHSVDKDVAEGIAGSSTTLSEQRGDASQRHEGDSSRADFGVHADLPSRVHNAPASTPNDGGGAATAPTAAARVVGPGVRSGDGHDRRHQHHPAAPLPSPATTSRPTAAPMPAHPTATAAAARAAAGTSVAHARRATAARPPPASSPPSGVDEDLEWFASLGAASAAGGSAFASGSTSAAPQRGGRGGASARGASGGGSRAGHPPRGAGASSSSAAALTRRPLWSRRPPALAGTATAAAATPTANAGSTAADVGGGLLAMLLARRGGGATAPAGAAREDECGDAVDVTALMDGEPANAAGGEEDVAGRGAAQRPALRSLVSTASAATQSRPAAAAAASEQQLMQPQHRDPQRPSAGVDESDSAIAPERASKLPRLDDDEVLALAPGWDRNDAPSDRAVRDDSDAPIAGDDSDEGGDDDGMDVYNLALQPAAGTASAAHPRPPTATTPTRPPRGGAGSAVGQPVGPTTASTTLFHSPAQAVGESRAGIDRAW